MEQVCSDPSETPYAKSCEDYNGHRPKQSTEINSVRVRKNNMTTRISARPPPAYAAKQSNRSSSNPSSDFHCDESSPSSSSICTSTPVSGPTPMTSDRTESNGNLVPSYMGLTESTKAKRRSFTPTRLQRQSMDENQFNKKEGSFYGDNKSMGSEPSVNYSRPLRRSEKHPLRDKENDSCYLEAARKTSMV